MNTIKDILKPKSVDELLNIEGKYFHSKLFLIKLRNLNPPSKLFNELLYNEHIRSINLDSIFRKKRIGPIKSYSDLQYILDLLRFMGVSKHLSIVASTEVENVENVENGRGTMRVNCYYLKYYGHHHIIKG